VPLSSQPAFNAVPHDPTAGKRKLILTRSKSSRFATYRVGMHGITPDGIALFAGMIFLAGFVAIAVWLLRR